MRCINPWALSHNRGVAVLGPPNIGKTTFLTKYVRLTPLRRIVTLIHYDEWRDSTVPCKVAPPSTPSALYSLLALALEQGRFPILDTAHLTQREESVVFDFGLDLLKLRGPEDIPHLEEFLTQSLEDRMDSCATLFSCTFYDRKDYEGYERY